MLDVRNDYEWEIGRFKGAEKPPCRMFREFPAYATRLKKRYDPEKTCVLMYCTGGIRCEYFSSLLRAEGYVSLHQLRGGVLGYGREVGTDHWEGNLFVFDDRLVIPLSDDEGEPIAHCRHCKTKSDACYNCANMECNALFPCCVTCCGTFAGCCSPECMRASRVRPCKPARRPKPFRKLGSRNGG
ncbi:MAG: rhodanese-like domain-containing protein [Simkaniaceae bacterium]|nr:rhodanese-like domain-containing protein [Simkaniaceae bacterium]